MELLHCLPAQLENGQKAQPFYYYSKELQSSGSLSQTSASIPPNVAHSGAPTFLRRIVKLFCHPDLPDASVFSR